MRKNIQLVLPATMLGLYTGYSHRLTLEITTFCTSSLLLLISLLSTFDCEQKKHSQRTLLGKVVGGLKNRKRQAIPNIVYILHRLPYNGPENLKTKIYIVSILSSPTYKFISMHLCYAASSPVLRNFKATAVFKQTEQSFIILLGNRKMSLLSFDWLLIWSCVKTIL